MEAKKTRGQLEPGVIPCNTGVLVLVAPMD